MCDTGRLVHCIFMYRTIVVHTSSLQSSCGSRTISAHVGVTNLDSVVVRLSAGECLEDGELQEQRSFSLQDVGHLSLFCQLHSVSKYLHLAHCCVSTYTSNAVLLPQAVPAEYLTTKDRGVLKITAKSGCKDHQPTSAPCPFTPLLCAAYGEINARQVSYNIV